MGSYALPVWGWNIYKIYLEFFHMVDLPILFHLPIYSIICLHQYELMEMYFKLWAITRYLIFYSSFSVLVIRSSFVWCLITLTPPMWSVFFFYAYPYFLALEDVLGSSCIFSSSVIELAISSRSPGSFH